MLLSVTIVVLASNVGLHAFAQPVVWDLPPEDESKVACGFTPLDGVTSTLIYDVEDPLDGVYNHHPHLTINPVYK